MKMQWKIQPHTQTRKNWTKGGRDTCPFFNVQLNQTKEESEMADLLQPYQGLPHQ